jgi:hypothetical protein
MMVVGLGQFSIKLRGKLNHTPQLGRPSGRPFFMVGSGSMHRGRVGRRPCQESVINVMQKRDDVTPLDRDRAG